MTAVGAPAVAQVLAPGLVLLGPQGLAKVAQALDVAVRAQRSEGLSLPAEVRVLVDAIAAALDLAGSGFGTTLRSRTGVVGTSEPPGEATGAVFGQDVADVTEVVEVLEVSREYACRLFRNRAFTTGRKVGGRWQVDRLELLAWLDGERQEGTG